MVTSTALSASGLVGGELPRSVAIAMKRRRLVHGAAVAFGADAIFGREVAEKRGTGIPPLRDQSPFFRKARGGPCDLSPRAGGRGPANAAVLLGARLYNGAEEGYIR